MLLAGMFCMIEYFLEILVEQPEWALHNMLLRHCWSLHECSFANFARNAPMEMPRKYAQA